MTTPGGMNAHQIIEALRQHHSPRKYAGRETPATVFFEELRLGLGWDEDALKRIDAWVMKLWAPREIVAYEVKISRSDFRAELRKPTKRKLALFYSNQFYFATPEGLIRPDELPSECGLVEITEDGRVLLKVRAPWRDCHPPSWNFLGSIARRAALEASR